MTIAIMQPYFFPYLGYFQLVNSVDTFVFYDDVNFIKSGWINRNRILVNGQANYFNIGLKNASVNSLINQTVINRNEKDISNKLKTLEIAYKKAPHFNEVFQLIVKILNFKANYIDELAMYSINKISKYLGITTRFEQSSIISNHTKALKKEKRLIEICKDLDADRYINPIGGQELYTKAEFKKEGIDLLFIKSHEISYKQFNNEFIPWLSIIDVLMFNDVSQARKFLNQYELI